MKVLKILGIILVVIIGLWIVLAAVAPAELQVEKSTSINASNQTVFDNVACLDKWQAWSAWQAMDPAMKNEYSENPCGVGAWNSWDGPQAGKGKQTIDEVNGIESIVMSLVFEGFEGTNYANWTFSEEDGVTTVTWNFLGAPSPFMMRPMNMLMKGVLEQSYETGLASLKEIAESASKLYGGYEVSQIPLFKGQGLLISGDVEPKNIGEFYGNSFGKIMGYMQETGVEMVGHPSGLFYSWSDTLAKMAAVIAINKPVDGTDEIKFHEFEEREGISIDYYGAYDQSGDAHYAMELYMEENGLEMNGPCIETYVTDPMSEPDTSKWLTQIIYPVLPKQ